MAQYQVGIQLYTVRDAAAADFRGTVAALAAMGYQGVELAGNYGGMTPNELEAFLRALGLELAGQHVSLADIGNPGSDPYRYAVAAGCKFLTTSLCGEVDKDWKGTIRQVAAAAATAKAAGMIFTYHNHAQEFARIDGVYALDMLYQQTDPGAVQGELDTFWIKTGGVDPVGYIAQYPGRVPQLHIKDRDAATKSFTEVGCGLLDWPAIFAASVNAGARWMIVEQDTCPGPSLESARKSIDYLKRAGLA